MNIKSIHVLVVLLIPFLLQAQKEIQAFLENGQLAISATNDLRSGEDYQLKIIGINTIFIQDRIRIRSVRYISPTPDILRPILPGIPSSYSFQDFNVTSTVQREFFLKALQFFNELEILRSESDDLYTKTRLLPDPVLAAEKLKIIDSLFDKVSFQEKVRRIHFYQDYILAAQSVYETNLKKVTLKTPEADGIFEEYARLVRIGDQTAHIDYERLLDYIMRSNQAKNFILSDVFTAEKDLTDIALALYDTYIEDTIYSGKLTFYTKQNWSFDFSAGFFFTNLYDKDYYLMGNADGRQYIREEKRFKGDVSIGALVHFSYKINPKLRLGPSFGASISPFDRNIRYLAGLSVFAGSEHIVGISGGLSLGQVDVLSGGVQANGRGHFLSVGESKIPVYTRIKSGYFIGLTYNLSRNKKP